MNKEKILKAAKKNIVAVIFITVMSVIYIYTMFSNKPWYDELYTYYYFISRGPLYAAIHWPVPNNHVGYSVLSAFLDLFGNQYIGLRGVSCIAAIANLILLYRLSRKFMDRFFATGVIALYAGAHLLFRLSIQGRGYTLAITCYLITITEIYNICTEIHKRRNYVIFAVAMMYGLYILPSSVYWVIPSCISGGLYLLMKKYYDRLKKMIISSLAAAAGTFALYSIIWLAIGANLISKNPESALAGVNQAVIVLKDPVGAFTTGIRYMLDTPYIQSINRITCVRTMHVYLKELFDNYYSYSGISIFILAVIICIWNISNASRQLYYKRKRFMASIFVVTNLLAVPVMLMLQSVHPYKRVLGFYFIPIAFGVMHMLNNFCEEYTSAAFKKHFGICTMCAAIIVALYCINSESYRAPLADRENVIEDVLAKVDTSKIDKMHYTDDYQKYVLKFYHDVTPEECEELADANYVMIGPELRDNKYTEPVWPVMYSYHMARLNYIEDKMTELASNGSYTIYARQ